MAVPAPDIPQPVKGKRAMTKTTCATSIKVGCTCAFVVKKLMLWPEITEIVYKQHKHVNEHGENTEHWQNEVYVVFEVGFYIGHLPV